MWELDCEESWAPKNWCFWTVMLEKTLESPLDYKEIQPVHSEGDQPWVFFGRNAAEAETPVLWPPHAKSWLIGKDSDAGRDWGQEEKGTTEDEMAGWHYWLYGREFEWTPGVGDGQGDLACCDSWGCKESDTTERLNWTELNWSKKGLGQPSIFWISQRFLISLFFTIQRYTLTTGLSKKPKLRISISRLRLGTAWCTPHHAVCLVNKETRNRRRHKDKVKVTRSECGSASFQIQASLTRIYTAFYT